MTPLELFARDLMKRYRVRDDQIGHCRHEVETKIDKDTYDVLVKKEDGKLTDDVAGRLLYHFDITLGNTFRYTLVCGVCAILEEAVKAIAVMLIPDAPTRKAAFDRARATIRKTNGHCNTLQAYVAVIDSVVPLAPTDQFNKDMEELTDVITLRNCIQHDWGNIDKSDYAKQVNDALGRIGVAAERGNYNLAQRSLDGFLVLGDNMVGHAQCLAIPIIDFLCRAIINHERAKA
jgi:hypothetical protein